MPAIAFWSTESWLPTGLDAGSSAEHQAKAAGRNLVRTKRERSALRTTKCLPKQVFVIICEHQSATQPVDMSGISTPSVLTAK